MNEQRLRDALRDAPLDDAGARARTLRVVRAAYAEREPVRPRRRWAPVLVRSRRARSPPWSSPRRSARPVTPSRAGCARCSAPGARTRGRRSCACPAAAGSRSAPSAAARGWSPPTARAAGSATTTAPRGRRTASIVVAWRGGELLAVEPGGRVRWSLARRGAISLARWSPVDGFRIAYRSGTTLRVVNGDGTGDRALAAARAVAPAWRPDRAHVLAYVDGRERVRVLAVDSGPRAVADRAGAGRARAGVVAGRRPPARRDAAPAARLRPRRAAARAPAAARRPRRRRRRLVAARRPRGGRAARRRSAATSCSPTRPAAAPPRLLYTGPGRFGRVAWSPSGRRLLVPWPEADQWLFLSTDGGRIAAVANIRRQFAAGPRRGAFPDAVEWCCTPLAPRCFANISSRSVQPPGAETASRIFTPVSPCFSKPRCSSSTSVPSPSGVNVTSTSVAFAGSGSYVHSRRQVPRQQQPARRLVLGDEAPVALGAVGGALEPAAAAALLQDHRRPRPARRCGGSRSATRCGSRR